MEKEQKKQSASDTPKNERKGFNITSMILGIISVVCIYLWYVSIPTAIVAIIFSIVGRIDSCREIGVVGMVFGILSLTLYLSTYVTYMLTGVVLISSLV